MDVVVTGRHIELSERFRSHVAEKLTKLEKHDHRIMRVQVEVESERNPRQHDRAIKVELTAFSKGPVIRAGDGGSRCDLEVSPASTGPPDAGRRGRRPVVAEKLRKPQQAAVGTKTRSAGRTPSSPGPGKAGGRSVQRVLPVIGG